MDKELKIFALEYIKLHDGLIAEEKLALGEFVMEASDEQVKFMLFTGEVKDNLTEEDLESIKEVSFSVTPSSAWNPSSIDVHLRNIGSEEFNIAALAAVALIARLGYKVYKDRFGKYGKQCSHLKHGHPERKKCERAAKSKALQAQVSALKKTMTKICPKSKDPDKCKTGTEKKIISIQQKIQKLGAK